MKVKDFSIKIASFGSGDLTIREVFKRWIKEKINIFVVTDRSNPKKIVGVLTLYDILKELIPFYLKLDEILVNFLDESFLESEEINKVLDKTVEELMTTKVVTVEEDDIFLKAIVIMYHRNFDYLPVINSKGEFTGRIITRNSVEQALLDQAVSKR